MTCTSLAGRETLYEDDLPEEEVEAELAPLTSQLAHVASMLNREEEATASYQDLLTKHQAEDNILAVVQNNLLAIHSSTQSHPKRFAAEALKKFESFMDHEHPGQLVPAVESRLSSQQRQALHVNHALLLLLSGKVEACEEKLTQLKSRSCSLLCWCLLLCAACCAFLCASLSVLIDSLCVVLHNITLLHSCSSQSAVSCNPSTDVAFPGGYILQQGLC